MPTTWIAFDTETASVRGAPHLLELGAVRMRADEPVESFEALVRPDVPIDPWASAIHGIRDEHLAGACAPIEALERFCEWARDDPLVAHNARFDGRVLACECARRRLGPPRGCLHDSLRLARRVLPDAPDHKLATLVRHLDLGPRPPHRALADAHACARVVLACLARAGLPSGAAPRDWPARSGHALAFAAFLPRLRLPERLDELARACEHGLRATLLYGEPGELPRRLSVWPRLCYRQRLGDYLEARCEHSGLVKTYRLDRIRRVDSEC